MRKVLVAALSMLLSLILSVGEVEQVTYVEMNSEMNQDSIDQEVSFATSSSASSDEVNVKYCESIYLVEYGIGDVYTKKWYGYSKVKTLDTEIKLVTIEVVPTTYRATVPVSGTSYFPQMVKFDVNVIPHQVSQINSKAYGYPQLLTIQMGKTYVGSDRKPMIDLSISPAGEVTSSTYTVASGFSFSGGGTIGTKDSSLNILNWSVDHSSSSSGTMKSLEIFTNPCLNNYAVWEFDYKTGSKAFNNYCANFTEQKGCLSFYSKNRDFTQYFNLTVSCEAGILKRNSTERYYFKHGDKYKLEVVDWLLAEHSVSGEKQNKNENGKGKVWFK